MVFFVLFLFVAEMFIFLMGVVCLFFDLEMLLESDVYESVDVLDLNTVLDSCFLS